MNCPQVALQESHPKASEGDRVAHRGEEGGDGIRRPLLWETQGATGTGAATATATSATPATATYFLATTSTATSTATATSATTARAFG